MFKMFAPFRVSCTITKMWSVFILRLQKSIPISSDKIGYEAYLLRNTDIGWCEPGITLDFNAQYTLVKQFFSGINPVEKLSP